MPSNGFAINGPFSAPLGGPHQDITSPTSPGLSKANSTNHSRPYTFESRRGPHYYPFRLSSATAASTVLGGQKTHSTATAEDAPKPPSVKSTGSSSTTRTRSPPLHPDEIFQPPSLGNRAMKPSSGSRHMYNPAAASTSAFHYANPAVEPAPFGWNAQGGLVDYSAPPGYLEVKEHNQRKLLSRTRMVLRILATLCSIAIVAGLGSAIAVFFDTRDDGLVWAGEPIWSSTIDSTPSTTLLVIGGVLTFISLLMLILSMWEKIRHVSFTSNIVNIVISSVNIGLAIFGAAFFAHYKGTDESPTFWNWVCDHGVEDSSVQFGMLCGETTFSYGMAYAVVVLEVLVLMNIVVGWVALGRNGGRSVGMERTIVVQVKKAEKNQGQWKGGY